MDSGILINIIDRKPEVGQLSPVSNWKSEVKRENKTQWLQRIPTASGDTLHNLENPSDIDEVIFDLLSDGAELLPLEKFWNAIHCSGIRRDDPRLQETENAFSKELEKLGISAGDHHGMHHKVDRETFRKCIHGNIFMVGEIFKNDLVVKEFATFCDEMEKIYEKCKENNDGKPSHLTPQIARANPKLFGVSICTIDGQRESFGDADVPFTLQALCKPFNYALARSGNNGLSDVHEFVGREPSGRGGAALSLDHANKPHNPLISTGGLVVSTMLQPQDQIADRFDHILLRYRQLAGHGYTGFNNPCYLSMRDRSDRDFALSHYLRENKCFPNNGSFDLHKAVEFFFQLKSIEVTAESGAVMAATLANGGICPTTGERKLTGEAVRDTLSLMYACGLYDYSGQFAFKVGLPAKSGCSGGVMLVVPNVMGVCVWSPNVDSNNNSVRGTQFCEELVQMFNFHNYDNLKHTVQKMDPRNYEIDKRDKPIVNLLFGAAVGDVNTIRRYMLSKMDMGSADYDKRTALHIAAAEGQLHIVKMLIEQCKVKPNPEDRYNFTPLDDAKKFGHKKVEEYLSNVIKNMEKANKPKPKASAK